MTFIQIEFKVLFIYDRFIIYMFVDWQTFIKNRHLFSGKPNNNYNFITNLSINTTVFTFDLPVKDLLRT